MCGIAGWHNNNKIDDEIIASIKEDLFHRGPDAQDHIRIDNSGLIHTRLSILDLSPLGNQPISDNSGTIHVVFNGEIYNHKKLREELVSKGYQFKSKTDSEVIPSLFKEYGSESFRMLHGMFSIALFDSETKDLYLVRDRLGIKPLFYSIDNNSFFFSSEIRAMLNFPIKDRSINTQSIYDFASLNFIPAPSTFFNSIQCLLPGEYLKVSILDNAVSYESSKYYSLKIQPNLDLKREEAIQQTSNLLDSAISSQLESDVALGSFLSAGIDSSLIAHSASKYISQTNGVDNLKTFTVDLDDQKYNESDKAEKIAEHLGTTHKNIVINESLDLASVKDFLLSTGQPYADVSMFGVNMIAKAMKSNITVALSGDGADEVFGGYYIFHSFEKKLFVNKVFRIFPFFSSLFNVFSRSKISFLKSLGKKVMRNISLSDTRMIADFFTYITEEEREKLLKKGSYKSIDRFFDCKDPIMIDELKNNRKETFSARLTEICFKLQLPNDFLYKVDFASMKESLEVRVPMLDEKLVDFGLSIPHSMKVHNNKGKFLLRETFRKRYKSSNVSKLAERKKTGFFIPIFQHLNEDSIQEVRQYLLDENNKLSRYFNIEVYSKWTEEFFDKKNLKHQDARATQKILMLLSLSLFLEKYE